MEPPVSKLIHKAVYDGMATRVRRLVQGGTDVDEKDSRGQTPLHVATIQSNGNIVLLLLDLGADVKATTDNLWTVLHLCGQYGGKGIAQALLDRGADSKAVDGYQQTPLHFCAEYGQAEVAELLLQGGAHVDARNWDQCTPLHISAKYGWTDVAQALLDYGADVNAVAKDSWRPLHMCAQEDSVEIAQMLLHRGAVLEALTIDGQRPLHICAEYGTVEVACALLQSDANIEALNESCSTPLHVCVEAKKIDILTFLLEKGANVDAVDNKQRTPLHIAAEHGYVEITRRLLERGARLDLNDENGDTALFVAIENGCCGLVIEMLRHDPEGIIHARDPWGETPLHTAVMIGNESIARALLDAGARTDIIDKAGKTPWDYAEDEQESMKKLLAERWRQSPGNQSKPLTSGPFVQEHVSADDKLHEPALSSAESHNDESSCFPSKSEEWTPDNPFGSRAALLRKLQNLRPGDDLADCYTVCAGAVAGRPHLKLARPRFGKGETVVIKFYCDENVYSNVQSIHSALHNSDHICRMVERLKTERTDFPPSLVFEKGSKTLKEWLTTGDRYPLEKRRCLFQVLLGLRDAHSYRFVHGDLNPSNIMWFGNEGKWKLIDWDGAREEGAGTVVTMSPAYSAPELVVPYYNTGVLPLARKALDIWSVGIMACELLTGTPVFKDDASLGKIVSLITDGEVDRKLEKIRDIKERDAISNFLATAPDERWTIADALQHDLFSSDDLSTADIETRAASGSRSTDELRGRYIVSGLRIDWTGRRILPSRENDSSTESP